MLEIYEYCGFEYYVFREHNIAVKLVPVEDQHKAAYKDKHIYNALEQLRQDEKKVRAGIRK